MKGIGYLFVGIAIVLLANSYNGAMTRSCKIMYKQLDQMSIEKTQTRLDLEDLYFKACMK